MQQHQIDQMVLYHISKHLENTQVEASDQYRQCLAHVVVSKVASFGQDLESFARHAKRTVINADDVKLILRRNPDMMGMLVNLKN